MPFYWQPRREKFAPSAAAAREESSNLSLVNFNVAVRGAANATGANRTSSRLALGESQIEAECAGWSSHMPETSAHGKKSYFQTHFLTSARYVREDGERNVCTNRAINYDIVSRGIKLPFSGSLSAKSEGTNRRSQELCGWFVRKRFCGKWCDGRNTENLWAIKKANLHTARERERPRRTIKAWIFMTVDAINISRHAGLSHIDWEMSFV